MTAATSLAEALAAFQAEAPTFNKSKTAKVQAKTGASYTYRYADLGDILPKVGPLLAKHGLSWSSKPVRDQDGELVLRYRLLHTSGEVDEGEMPLGVEKRCKPQELGSAITYMRRYALTAQLNLATDEDDDGAAASGRRPEQTAATNGNGNGHQPTAPPAQPSELPASANQRKMLWAKYKAAGLTPVEFANVVMLAKGQQPRDTEDQEAAGRWLGRELERLPARLVDAVVDGIGGAS